VERTQRRWRVGVALAAVGGCAVAVRARRVALMDFAGIELGTLTRDDLRVAGDPPRRYIEVPEERINPPVLYPHRGTTVVLGEATLEVVDL
jgi:hypothetical protein